ncbi:response regulator [Spongiibacter nanhainus]|uniref:response regulator n=1 Tax=Spongiibacter nanhainus TaxID=2794344 RepID=UPI001E3B1708|nr:response regulator [Spongiibacter nanhainus]
MSRWKERPAPDVVLVDYHLDNGETGLDVLQALTYHWGKPLPAVVISADNGDELRQRVQNLGYRFLPKPVKPAALRGLIRKLWLQSA